MTTYKIYLIKKSDKGKVSKDECFISDGRMVTRHNDPNDTFKIYTEKRKKGESVDWKRGILIEYFKDQSAEEIKNHVEDELKLMESNLKKDVTLSWRVEDV